MKKPDKFERMVDELGSFEDCATSKAWVPSSEAVAVLRQYHNEVVEMVEKERNWDGSPERQIAYNEAIGNILDKLKELSK